jgi:hypothetical protein
MEAVAVVDRWNVIDLQIKQLLIEGDLDAMARLTSFAETGAVEASRYFPYIAEQYSYLLPVIRRQKIDDETRQQMHSAASRISASIRNQILRRWPDIVSHVR